MGRCGVCCSYKHQTTSEGTAPHAFFGDATNYAWVTAHGPHAGTIQEYTNEDGHDHEDGLQWSDGQENFRWSAWNPYQYTTVTKNIGHPTTRVHHTRHSPVHFGDDTSAVDAGQHRCTAKDSFDAEDEMSRCECFQDDGSSCRRPTCAGFACGAGLEEHATPADVPCQQDVCTVSECCTVL